MRGIVAAVVASALLLGAYLALGGGDNAPAAPPDPCALRGETAESAGGEVTGTFERIGLNALAGAACELGITRERLLLGLADVADLAVPVERQTEAFRTGLREAIAAEEAAGNLDAAEAFFLRQAVEALPVDVLLEQVFGRRAAPEG